MHSARPGMKSESSWLFQNSDTPMWNRHGSQNHSSATGTCEVGVVPSIVQGCKPAKHRTSYGSLEASFANAEVWRLLREKTDGLDRVMRGDLSIVCTNIVFLLLWVPPKKLISSLRLHVFWDTFEIQDHIFFFQTDGVPFGPWWGSLGLPWK